MVTAIIEVKVTPEANLGYKGVAKIIAEFKEVESVYLTSGSYDLNVIVNCSDMKQIGSFVATKLSTIRGVGHTTTNIIMEKYKQAGEILEVDDDDREIGLI
jgi:DNA-binding Lrp family transcriptional regulator